MLSFPLDLPDQSLLARNIAKIAVFQAKKRKIENVYEKSDNEALIRPSISIRKKWVRHWELKISWSNRRRLVAVLGFRVWVGCRLSLFAVRTASETVLIVSLRGPHAVHGWI